MTSSTRPRSTSVMGFFSLRRRGGLFPLGDGLARDGPIRLGKLMQEDAGLFRWFTQALGDRLGHGEEELLSLSLIDKRRRHVDMHQGHGAHSFLMQMKHVFWLVTWSCPSCASVSCISPSTVLASASASTPAATAFLNRIVCR